MVGEAVCEEEVELTEVVVGDVVVSLLVDGVRVDVVWASASIAEF